MKHKPMKLKVCGMKYNPREVAALQPDYLGFIFWDRSPRSFDGDIPELPDTIKKVGVFVDASIDEVVAKINKYGLHAVQLHGNESPAFCKALKQHYTHRPVDIIKVFSIRDNFDFGLLTPYENSCDYYLFDTKGKLPGGNGYTFDWKVLKDYPSTKPFFLSGGIGLEEVESIREFMKRPEAKYCHAIDVNSRFEIQPGLKDIARLKDFKSQITGNSNKYQKTK